jgi:hypothetical protein
MVRARTADDHDRKQNSDQKAAAKATAETGNESGGALWLHEQEIQIEGNEENQQSSCRK